MLNGLLNRLSQSGVPGSIILKMPIGAREGGPPNSLLPLEDAPFGTCQSSFPTQNDHRQEYLPSVPSQEDEWQNRRGR